MYVEKPEDRKKLKRAYDQKNITLYLGAGVSIASGLPDWEKLVLSMYFSAISEQKLEGWRPFSNYLYAISEWYMKNTEEPLEIIARKLRKFLNDHSVDGSQFFNSLYSNLYGHLLNDRPEPDMGYSSYYFEEKNSTLKAISELCKSGNADKGVQAVISYNYDDLLETVLDSHPYQSIFRKSDFDADKLPIYHVHGFIPLNKSRAQSKENEIVFTEDQYHTVARDPYYWSNIIQVKSLSSSIGVMIGLSLSDRNMRRILDSLRNAPMETKNFALLQKPKRDIPEPNVIDEIHQKAIDYLDEFEDSGIKSDRNIDQVLFKSSRPGIKSSDSVPLRSGVKGPRYQMEIAGIIEEVQKLNQGQQDYVMKDLGITPIWYGEHSEIPEILDEIFDSE